MPITRGNITLHLGPQEQGGPDSLLDPIIAFIDNARPQQRLYIAVQELDHPDIARAIVRARQRKVSVDMVIEHDYLLSKKLPADPWQPGGAHEINRELFTAILRATVDVKSDYNSGIFHQKFMVRGNSVLTGSTNFTKTGVTKNLNHVVVIDDAKVANEYRREFSEIQQGQFGKISALHGDTPREATVSRVRVKPLFAPDHGPEMEIMKQILKAEDRIDFAIFTFAKSSGIDDALIAAHQRGVTVSGIFDRRQANQVWAAKKPLQAKGIDIALVGGSGGLGKLHHKMMTIDDKVSIFGSFNYTGPANKLNDENIVVIGDIEETNATAKRRQSAIARAARDEMDRIRSQFA